MRSTSHPLAVPALALTEGALALPAAALEIPIRHIASRKPWRHHPIVLPAVKATQFSSGRSCTAGLRPPVGPVRDHAAG